MINKLDMFYEIGLVKAHKQFVEIILLTFLFSQNIEYRFCQS